MTRERIRQIEAKALRKLKHPSRRRKVRSFLDQKAKGALLWWAQKMHDVASLEAHIAAGRDVVVSGDMKNSNGVKRDKIIWLGAGEICTDDEALEIARCA